MMPAPPGPARPVPHESSHAVQNVDEGPIATPQRVADLASVTEEYYDKVQAVRKSGTTAAAAGGELF
jgi:hypothetical protein